MRFGKYWTFALLALPLSFTYAAGPSDIHGTVKVAPALEKKVTPNAVLYVVARAAGAKGGPPVAVVRMASPHFPADFEIGPQNMMMGPGEFKGPFDLTVKLSKSGDVMTSPGDLLGTTEDKKPTLAGAKNVKLVLSTEAP